MRYHINNHGSARPPNQANNIRKVLPHSFLINFDETFGQRRGVGMKAHGDIV